MSFARMYFLTVDRKQNRLWERISEPVKPVKPGLPSRRLPFCLVKMRPFPDSTKPERDVHQQGPGMSSGGGNPL